VDALLSGADFAREQGSPRRRQQRHHPAARLGNRCWCSSQSHGTHYSDLCYGYNAFWQKYVPVLGLDVTSSFSKGDYGCGDASRSRR
jgi:hypothetical protein